jgi:hypothetical protein
MADGNSLEQSIKALIQRGAWQVSVHGQRKLQERQLILSEIVSASITATVVEEYPSYFHGPAILFLTKMADGLEIHVMWGIKLPLASCAYLVTAYLPDPKDWLPDNMTRKKS